jgi:hypothetical protein
MKARREVAKKALLGMNVCVCVFDVHIPLYM